jgi:hypothetical protein
MVEFWFEGGELSCQVEFFGQELLGICRDVS